MKKLFILASSLLAFNAFANELSCESMTSKVIMDRKTVTIEAKSIPLNDELRAIVTPEQLNVESKLNVGIRITFPKKDLDCSSDIAKVFTCTGKTKKASVTLVVDQQIGMNSFNMETSRRPVKIENIDIRTSIVAEGPIVIGAEQTTVALNQLKVNSSMLVKMNGQFHLDLEQNFETQLCK